MTFLIVLLHLLAAIILGGIAYVYMGRFQELGKVSMTRFNKDINKSRQKIDKETMKELNDYSFTIFIIAGFFIWSYESVTIGRIVSNITDHFILKWVVYVLGYFVFLRAPFRFLNKFIMKDYNLKTFPERKLFYVIIVFFYVAAIFYYDDIPKMFKWYLGYLD